MCEIETMICELCKRDSDSTTKHHLIPRTLHRNKKAKKLFTRDRMNEKINVCPSCRRQIHALIPEKDMAFQYNTVEALISHPEVAKFLEWIKGRSGDVPASRLNCPPSSNFRT